MRWISESPLSRFFTRDRAVGLLWGLALAPFVLLAWWLFSAATDGFRAGSPGSAALLTADENPGADGKTAALAPANVRGAGFEPLPRQAPPADGFRQPVPQPQRDLPGAGSGKLAGQPSGKTGNNDKAKVPGDAAQPVQHARNAAVSSCLPALRDLSRIAVDAPHVAFSTWNNQSANDRLFQSIVSLKYSNKIAPRGISVLVAAPNSQSKCDGATVQIQPSALSCEKIARNITGRNIAGKTRLVTRDLAGITLIQTSNSMRLMLMPTRGRGCAVVGVGVFYAK